VIQYNQLCRHLDEPGVFLKAFPVKRSAAIQQIRHAPLDLPGSEGIPTESSGVMTKEGYCGVKIPVAPVAKGL
jgi:hypothetical protein